MVRECTHLLNLDSWTKYNDNVHRIYTVKMLVYQAVTFPMCNVKSDLAEEM